MKGGVLCPDAAGPDARSSSDTLSLTISNRSNFDWRFDVGDWPLRLGTMIHHANGTHIADKQIPVAVFLPAGGSAEILFPLSSLFTLPGVGDRNEIVAKFALLQDGHAWFVHAENDFCQIRVRRQPDEAALVGSQPKAGQQKR
jgi:hypothetical protein